MVVCRWYPRRRSMTLSADLAEIIGHMVGVIDSGVIALMTGVTLDRDILVTRRVARNALQRDVRPRQRELRVGMIE